MVSPDELQAQLNKFGETALTAIDTFKAQRDEAREIAAELVLALRPFAEFSEFVKSNYPGFYHEAFVFTSISDIFRTGDRLTMRPFINAAAAIERLCRNDPHQPLR